MDEIFAWVVLHVFAGNPVWMVVGLLAGGLVYQNRQMRGDLIGVIQENTKANLELAGTRQTQVKAIEEGNEATRELVAGFGEISAAANAKELVDKMRHEANLERWKEVAEELRGLRGGRNVAG